MYVVGLTGGIGSGKSTVADRFRALGAAVVDTDVIAHQLTSPGQAGTKAILTAFGPNCVAQDGTLDRAWLRQRVFNDPNAKAQLEAILHPMILRAALAQLQDGAASPYAVLVVPLLFETGAYADTIRRALVVDCPETLQIERVVARSGLDAAMAQRIMSAQMSRAERLQHADDVLCNDGDLDRLMHDVDQLHAEYVAKASSET